VIDGYQRKIAGKANNHVRERDMDKHDFRRILCAANSVAIAMATAGCADAGLKANAAPASVQQARTVSIENSSGSGGADAGHAASLTTATLTELKHFVVYQRFHGLLNVIASDDPSEQYSGGSSDSSSDRSGTGQQLRTGDAFSCLPAAIFPQTGTDK
jgi:hypothetical protein